MLALKGRNTMHSVNARTAYLSWRCVNSLETVEEMRTSVTLSASQHPVRRSKLVPRAAAKERVPNNGTSPGVGHFKSPLLSLASSVCLFWGVFLAAGVMRCSLVASSWRRTNSPFPVAAATCQSKRKEKVLPCLSFRNKTVLRFSTLWTSTKL